MSVKIKMGYKNAYDYLKLYTSKKKGKEKDMFKDILNDFAYCIERAERMDKMLEAKQLIQEAFKGGE